MTYDGKVIKLQTDTWPQVTKLEYDDTNRKVAELLGRINVHDL